jgi:hypothetical protein
MINKTNIRKWVKALRSGKYKQTSGTLQDDVGYCCLGVACDVFAKETGKGKWRTADFSSGKQFITNFGTDEEMIHEADLPPAVMRWFGIRKSDPVLRSRGQTASHVNDVEGWDFDEIASAIERKYLKKGKKKA